ncbi:MAG TPA: hypothetical protein DCE41_11235 [Cytophagales bacterium]|nr:hypothetical protein [Cytophagales bacterium]HAA24226.1 hypothetical protein [Cytophagales bacterium]HAP59716.1 hypothetical protein [Cytophagales bacterium]
MSSIFSAILLIGFVQGLTVCLAFLIKIRSYKHRNYYFLMLLASVTLVLLAKWAFSPELYGRQPHIWFAYDTLAYVLGPLWYLTILKSIRPKVEISRSDILGVSPVLVQLVMLVRISLMSNVELIDAGDEPWMDVFFLLYSFSVIAVNLFFFWKALRIIQAHKDIHFPELLRQGHYAFTAIFGLWLVAFGINLLLSTGTTVQDYFYTAAFLSFAVLTFSLAVLAMVKPTSFHFLTQVYDSSETFLLKELADKVTHYMQSEEPFLERHYTLNQLAEAIQANPIVTSKAINRVLNKSFSDLINEHRVAYFLKSKRQNTWPHLSNEGVAERSGFGNKVSFYKAFKKETGQTPKAYLSQLGIS